MALVNTGGGIAATSTQFAPQLAGLAGPLSGMPWLFGGSVVPGANVARGVRVVIPRSGTLHDFSVCFNAAGAHVDVAVYSLAAEPRSRLWSAGATAVPGTGWQIIADPALAVTQGQIVDFAVACDDGVSDIYGFFAKDVGIGTLPSTNFWTTAGGSSKVVWTKSASYPLPATLADSGLTAYSVVPALMCRVA